MIDIHSHILPGVDDGSDSLETSKALLSQYAFHGVDCVICTPHQNRLTHSAETLKSKFVKFSEEVADMPVSLYLGAEILYYKDMAKDVASGELLTLGGSKYVLVEFPVTCSGEYLCDAVYELTIADYIPVIAHIERYVGISKKDCFAVRDAGALIQVNASAFNNKGALKQIKFLLKNGLVDFIASDCHDAKYRNVDFTAAKALVGKKFPKQYDKLFNRKFS
ncbi:MAG: tyrosine-protein phosphatase [Candidatus Coproplasma sp.]